MILCAGLSPAWQHFLLLDDLELGEVNRLEKVLRASAGKVLNACWAIGTLEGLRPPLEVLRPGSGGAESTTSVACEESVPAGGASARVRALTVLGGAYRAMIEDEMRRFGVPLRVVPCRAPTRVATTLIESRGGRATELVENQGALAEDELGEFLDVFAAEAKAADHVVLTGSLPAGAPPATYRDLISSARGRVLLDARGPELLAALPARPFLVKPNRMELARTLGRELDTEREVIAGMQELRGAGAQWALVTQGREDLLLLGESGAYRVRTPSVRSIQPIGCGDTLTGALAWSLDRGDELLDAVRLAVAAAARNAEQVRIGILERGGVEALARELEVRPIAS